MIYIVTPVFNRKTFTKNYLQALKEQTCKDFKTIIVDDGSSDGTSKMVEQHFPEVILLKEKGNLWWAEATNIGVRYAINHGATFIMTLNDDTLPLPDYIEKMIYWSTKNQNALLGAFAVNVENMKPLYGGEILNWGTGKYENILKTIPDSEMFGLKEVNVFPGRGLLIPVDVFNDIGYYDSKNFPQTVADLDFTMRANNYGYKIYCNYDAKIKIFPDESSTIKLKKNRSFKNFLIHLFGIRGGGNLKYFTIYTIKNAPKIYMLPFLINGIVRRIVGYWITKRNDNASS